MSARLRVEIRGVVQGVGFRPFVFRLAHGLDLTGWVVNGTTGVVIEAEGARGTLEDFLARVVTETPGAARIHDVEHVWIDPAGGTGFEIRASDGVGERRAVLLPERATCAACRAEVGDPRQRRHRYPFTNCTECGPRFSIILALPYDRPNTTMRDFSLCVDCRREYEDPRDRRFHAQPVACPACGPALALWDARGNGLASRDEALARAAQGIREGLVVAVKGLGGFHLVCDAADAAAVARLREGKARQERPFAVMCRDLAEVRTLVAVDEDAARTLESTEAPIVLLSRRAGAPVAANVAPGVATLGVMLAYTPLHHLLLGAVARPVVATSGNIADEPIVIDERDALDRLGAIADAFLVHDRPIERHVDDSVGWMVRGAFRVLRRARGFAPLPVRIARGGPCVLAVGAHLKNTVALAIGRDVFVSQHIGDLGTPQAVNAFERVIHDLLTMYDAHPAAIAHDLHPDYVSTQWAMEHASLLGRCKITGGAGVGWSDSDGVDSSLHPTPAPPEALDRALAQARPTLIPVQHHHAHLAACLTENQVEGEALGVIWDGTGYGTDGTIWGGEFLSGDARRFERVAHLRPFRLPGGEAAVREPRRTAFALRLAVGARGGDAHDGFAAAERDAIARMLETGFNAPITTSAGRLFDGLAALIGLHPRITYEGQAAIGLEHAADPGDHGAYAFPLIKAPGGVLVLDWGPLVSDLLSDVARGAGRGIMAARVHGTMIDGVVRVAGAVGAPRVALSGGCFQNRRLLEGAAVALEAAGHEVLVHRHVPPNDGGVSLGQAAVAIATMMGT